MTHQISKEIAADIGPLVKRLAEFGYEPMGSLYYPEAFGNYYVDLNSGTKWLRIVCERSQYYVDASSKDELRAAGMFRAFDDRDTFERALFDWLRAA